MTPALEQHAKQELLAPHRSLSGDLPSEPVEVRDFTHADEPRVLELLGEAFRDWPRGVKGVDPGEFFRWKMFQSPFGQTLMLVAELAGKIVGFEARLAWDLSSAGRIVHTMRGTDLAVDPAFRRRGISMAIRRGAYYTDEIEFTWGNPNAQSRRGSTKFGRREIGIPAHFARPRRPLSTSLSRLLCRGTLTPSALAPEAPPAAEVLLDGDYVNGLVERVPQPGELYTTARDLAYLRWRYGSSDYYRAVHSERGAAGIAIFSLRRRGALWISDVCELLVEDDDLRTSRRLLDQVAHAAATDILYCCFRSRSQAALNGFVQAPSHTLLVATPLQRDIRPDPLARSSWALSLGDLELI